MSGSYHFPRGTQASKSSGSSITCRIKPKALLECLFHPAPTFRSSCQTHGSCLWYLKSLGAFALTAHSPNWQSRASQEQTFLPPCHLLLNLGLPSKLVLTSLAGKPMGAMADWAGCSGPSGALAICRHGLCSLLLF